MPKKDLEKKALNLLSEPFRSPYGFAYACLQTLEKIPKEQRQDFLVIVLDRYSLVRRKDKLSIEEKTLSPSNRPELFDPVIKDAEALCKAIQVVYPSTKEFADYLLVLIDKQPNLERKTIVLAYVIVRGLLPYAPNLPQPRPLNRGPEKVGELSNIYWREMAMIMRLTDELGDKTYQEVCDILLQILPEDPEIKSIFMAFFLSKFEAMVETRTAETFFAEQASRQEQEEVSEEFSSLPDPNDKKTWN